MLVSYIFMHIPIHLRHVVEIILQPLQLAVILIFVSICKMMYMECEWKIAVIFAIIYM